MKNMRNGSLYVDTVSGDMVRVRNHNLNTSSVAVTPPHADAPLQAVKLSHLRKANDNEVEQYLEEAGVHPKKKQTVGYAPPQTKEKQTVGYAPPQSLPPLPVPQSVKPKLPSVNFSGGVPRSAYPPQEV